MNSFSDEDGASNTEVLLGCDKTSASEVGRSANTLEDGGKTDEGLGVCVWEFVLASSNWLGTSSAESSGQKLNVSFLIVSNLLVC